MFLTNRQQCFQQACGIETGISDFQKMVVTVMKTHYKKRKAKTNHYRNYAYFREQSFNFELNSELLKIDITNAELKTFNGIFLKVLDKHAPRKQKYIRANNSNYTTKALRKKNYPQISTSKQIFEREQKNLMLPITNNEISA